MKKLLFIAFFMSAASLSWAQSAGSDAKNWEVQLQGGLSLPLSPAFANGYSGDSAYKFNTGYNFGGAVGYKISPQLTVMAEADQETFKTKGYPDSAPYNNYYYFWNTTELSLLLKYRISAGPLSPFVFAGPGIAVNAAGYQYYGASSPDYNYAYDLVEVDALLKAGVGLEYALNDDFSVFAQATYSVDFNSALLTDYVYGADMPTRYMPLQGGLILNL